MITKKQASEKLLSFAKSKGFKVIGKPRHVHPKCYVVGHAAPYCLIIAIPYADGEMHMQDLEMKYPLKIVHKFDPELKAGDWCGHGYILTAHSGEDWAVKL